MATVIFDNIPTEINVNKIMKKLRIDPESDYKNTFMELFQNAQKIVKPKAIYKEVTVETDGQDWVIIEGHKFSSRVVKVNLEETSKIIAFVMTCGQEVEEWSKNISDMLESFWVDTIKEEFLQAARDNVMDYLKEKYGINNLAQMNPGSVIDWPINDQKSLFAILGDVEKAIGVTLTDTFLMLPTKSGSGLFFAVASDYCSCKLCKREDCPNRQAPFDPLLWDEKYKIS